MAKSSNYDEVGVIRILEAKQGVHVDKGKLLIQVLENATGLGNGTWGKLDYLRKVHGYTVTMVKSLAKTHVVKKKNNVSKKRTNKPDGFNMATMSKRAMANAKSKTNK